MQQPGIVICELSVSHARHFPVK